MRCHFPGRAGGVRLLVWGPIYGGLLAVSCWLMSSCSDGPVRQDKDLPVTQATWTPPPGATYIGAEVCAGCHEKESKAFEKSHHGKKADPRTPAAKQGCETCHGPGSVHAEAGGGKGTILSFGPDSPATPAEKAGKCLECHERVWPEWQHGKHAARGVACVDCHSMHDSPPRAEHMLDSSEQPEVCEKCHKQIYTDLAQTSHHPLREGKMVCADCHNPHGSTTEKSLKASTVNELCYKCHTEKRGPFLWEHPPVLEDCLTCHTPHGSPHEKLLNTDRPLLCQRCHSTNVHSGMIFDSRTHFQGDLATDPMKIVTSCSNCHFNVHGSNHPSGRFFLR